MRRSIRFCNLGSCADRAFGSRNECIVNWTARKTLACACGCVIAGWALAHAGDVLVIDDPRVSDVIVVLAGETDHRPSTAESLLQRGEARHVVLDVPGGSTIYNVPQLEIARKYVDTLPQGKDWSICSIQGLSTKDEARDARHCVSELAPSVHSVLVVTSDFHTRRALSVMRHEFAGYDISVAAAYDSAQFGTRWWTHRQWAKVCVDEWLRLFWWQIFDRWR